MQFYQKYLDINPEVKNALLYNKPVVALDSTVICHGMPYPQNIETALKTEQLIRENGAIPATVAILNGRLKVGLTKKDIEYLGKHKSKIIKAGRGDIPFLVSRKLDGATTVATTMIIASFAGINVLSSGGIGGIQKEAHRTFDISSDLRELSSTNMAVVCSGLKLILNTDPTVEFLETHGIPIIGYRSNEFAGFYTKYSSSKVDYRLDKVEDIAKTLKIKWDLGINGGMLISNPIPDEYSMDHEIISAAVEKALAEAKEKNIRKKLLIPFLLEKVFNLTEGRSLKSNTELIYNNAKLAAQIAKVYCEVK